MADREYPNYYTPKDWYNPEKSLKHFRENYNFLRKHDNAAFDSA
jgi:hypothetical protein